MNANFLYWKFEMNIMQNNLSSSILAKLHYSHSTFTCNSVIHVQASIHFHFYELIWHKIWRSCVHDILTSHCHIKMCMWQKSMMVVLSFSMFNWIFNHWLTGYGQNHTGFLLIGMWNTKITVLNEIDTLQILKNMNTVPAKICLFVCVLFCFCFVVLFFLVGFFFFFGVFSPQFGCTLTTIYISQMKRLHQGSIS